jgi:hypothetical protein
MLMSVRFFLSAAIIAATRHAMTGTDRMPIAHCCTRAGSPMPALGSQRGLHHEVRLEDQAESRDRGRDRQVAAVGQLSNSIQNFGINHPAWPVYPPFRSKLSPAHALTPVGVYGMAGTVEFFESLGLPAWTAWATMLAETVGGVLLILGDGAWSLSGRLTPARAHWQAA